MHVAFHFDENLTERSVPFLTPLRHIELATIIELIAVIPAYRKHVRIRSGIPGTSFRQHNQTAECASDLLAHATVWQTIDKPQDYALYLNERQGVVEVIEGVSLEDAAAFSANRSWNH